MDIKCQQQQQQQQQQTHQQQQQQQQQQHVAGAGAGTGTGHASHPAMCPIAMGHNQLLLNGNERMLTTPTATQATTATTIASKTVTAATATAAGETGGLPTHNDKMASASQNVNGSCMNHNSSMVTAQQQQQHQQHQAMTLTMARQGLGPGPPMQMQPGRNALGKCSLNELNSYANQPSTTAAATPTPHTPQAPQMLQQQHTAMVMATGLGVGVGVGDGVGVGVDVDVGLGMSLSLAGSTVNHCAYCCQPICDRYIMRVVNNSFHEGCLKCTACSMHLINSCYARDGKLYCRLDYER